MIMAIKEISSTPSKKQDVLTQPRMGKKRLAEHLLL